MKKVGEKRKFSFSDEPFEIMETIDRPNISMKWTWTTGICPHCKKKITRNVNHEFLKIEILGKCESDSEDKNSIKNWKVKGDLKKSDLLVMGFTKDNKYMEIPIDEKAYNYALSASKKFKKFIN